MTKYSFFNKLEIKRNAIRKDMLQFALPAPIVFIIGLTFCNEGEALSGFWGNIWNLVKHPQNLTMFPVHSIIGMALIIIGFTIMIVSQATLWRNYSGSVVIREYQQLITHGIYRFTRNPIYLGAIIVVVRNPAQAGIQWVARLRVLIFEDCVENCLKTSGGDSILFLLAF